MPASRERRSRATPHARPRLGVPRAVGRSVVVASSPSHTAASAVFSARGHGRLLLREPPRINISGELCAATIALGLVADALGDVASDRHPLHPRAAAAADGEPGEGGQ